MAIAWSGVVCMGIAAVGLCSVLLMPLLSGRIFVHTDLGGFHLPLRHFYQQCLLKGEEFTWMPSILCGCYIQGEGQAGMYHPVHWLLYRLLPLDIAFNLEFFLSYAFLLAGMVVFLRRWRIPRAAALYGATGFTFSGFMLFHAMHMNLIAVMAHLPWLLWCMDKTLHAENRGQQCRWLSLIALLTASQVLLGFPQAVYFSSLAETLFSFFLAGMKMATAGEAGRGWKGLREIGKILLAVFAAKLTGLLIGAVQILPSLDLLSTSYRTGSTGDFRLSFSLHPLNLLQFLGPTFFRTPVASYDFAEFYCPHEFALYNGTGSILFLTWVLFRIPFVLGKRSTGAPNRHSWLTLAGLCLLFLSVLLALGKYGGLYALMTKLPLLNAFRAPTRHIVLVHFALAVLSALALADLLGLVNEKTPIPSRRLLGLTIPAIVTWGMAVWIWFLPTYPECAPEQILSFFAHGNMIFAGPVLLTLGTALLWSSARGYAPALIALMLFALIEQAVPGLRYLLSEPPAALADFVQAGDAPPGLTGYRYLAQFTNHLTMRGYANADGYIGPQLRYKLSGGSVPVNVLRVANVEWMTPEWSILPNETRWGQVPDPLPFARLVGQAQVSTDLLADMAAVDVNVLRPVPWTQVCMKVFAFMRHGRSIIR